MNKYLLTIGIILIIAGIFWNYITKIPFGHLPGDIVIEKPNFKFYFPIVTSIVISLVISLIFYLIKNL